jgi:hypothetical protein
MCRAGYRRLCAEPLEPAYVVGVYVLSVLRAAYVRSASCTEPLMY